MIHIVLAIALALGACNAKPHSEPARIEALLNALVDSDAIFIRNGSEHTAREAADHLRSKWRGADVTAEQFIDRYATKSSSSGRPYRVRHRGTERDAGPWLHELLATLR